MTYYGPPSKTYANRSSARRAARAECRRLFSSKIYDAREGVDFVLHPVPRPWPDGMLDDFSETPNAFRLIDYPAQVAAGLAPADL